jgi:hypothetical protein
MSENKVFNFFHSTEQGGKDIDEYLAKFPGLETEEVTSETVYRVGNKEARDFADRFIKMMVLPGSRIVHPEHLAKSFQLSQQGRSVLILSEHYTNFDLTNICYLANNEPLIGHDFAEKLVAMAGVKLSNGSDGFIAKFIQMYNRIVIIPSRTLAQLSDEERAEMTKLMGPVNLASMKELTYRKQNKHPILVFPTGTRVRPHLPETRQAVKEIYSYIKGFEYIQFISLNGDNLHVDDKDMSNDTPEPDVIMMGCAAPMTQVEFTAMVEARKPEGESVRDYAPKMVMQMLVKLHDEVEPIRQEVLGNHHQKS